MKITRIVIIFLLGILLVSGLACSLLGEATESTPNPPSSLPSAPTLYSPNNGATVYGTSITFQWNASPGATMYGLRVSRSDYPNLDKETEFFNIILGDVTQYTKSGFPDDGTEYVWGVWAGRGNSFGPKSEVLANARIFTNGVPYGASLTPKYMESGNQTYFLLTAYAKEPVYLDISNPDGSLLDRVYVPPIVETPEITENLYLPPAPSGGTYRFHMYSDVTGELVWEDEQTFTGPRIEILELSLNPHWVRGVGWDLQYLTMKLKNSGDMPIILYDLKLRLEKDGFSTEEINLAREGDIEAEFGWKTGGMMIPNPAYTGGNWYSGPCLGTICSPEMTGGAQRVPQYITVESLTLEPYNEASAIATIAPWGSEDQHLFGRNFNPDEYRLYVTLSEQLGILPVPELAFESF